MNIKNLIKYFIRHSILSNWIMIVIAIAGVFAVFNLKTRIDPKIERREINVDIPFPGASPIEVEEGIITKIEEALRGVDGIDEINSTSMDNYGSLVIEIDDGYIIDRAIQDIKNSVNSISSYPINAEKPVVYQNTGWNRAIMLSINGPEDLYVIKKIVDEFRDELLKTGKMSQFMIWGIPTREISIEISPDELIRHQLTIEDITSAILSSNLNISAGSVLTEQEQIMIRSYGRKYYVDEFVNIELISSLSGERKKLSDICDVKEKWPENRFYSEFNGNRSVMFNVMYSNNEDVVEIVEITENIAAKMELKYGGLVKFDTFIRETDDLVERLTLLTQSGLLGFGFIIITLGLFLNLRMAFWVSLGIPISFLGLFFILWIFGISINQMSLFGMILVVGILVDDGIIIGESIFSHYEKGKKPIQAAIDGTAEVIKPVAIAVITTMIAFMPYFYFYGELGNHVWQVGAVVIISLAFSLVEAVIILPGHIGHSGAIRATNTKNQQGAASEFRDTLTKYSDYLVNVFYKKLLSFSLEYRWGVSAGIAAMIMVIAGLFMGTHVKAQFFPEIEFPFARIRVEMPAGTASEVASQVRYKVIDKALEFAKIKEEETGVNPIQNYSSWYGGSVNIFLDLIPGDERDWSVREFSAELSEYIGEVSEAENVIIGSSNFGGNPISVKFLSSNYDQLMLAKKLMRSELQKIAGVKDIQDDTPMGNNEFLIHLKSNAKALGLTLRDVTTQLRQGFYGQEVMRLQRGRDEMKVWVRFDEQNRVSISQIENLKIRTPNGDYIPFKKIATYEIKRGIKRIRHEDGYRSVKVYANLDYSKNELGVIINELKDVIIPRVLAQTDNVTQSIGGQAEYVDKMTNSIKFTMAMAAVGIFTVLMFLLKSYVQTMLIMSLIPLGIIGAVFGHYLRGIPVSILSFLGIVALAGIIINDSVVLLDKYNRMIKSGLSVKDSLLSAGMARFRPILLTTITTAAGLSPLIAQRSEQGQWLVPMAVSVAAGLVFGTVLTLLMLPSSIYCISDLRVLWNKFLTVFGKPIKDRDALEPANTGSSI
ncbi:MAG: efflux RND transporter permease subunit [Candidatus Marinimicrobia bacterium]|jgi:multidrug efflux pump subunit AcrB|nr:efflux RND transporter permease subunit [Candidatus Neomarinimicrobiota bacterium]MBT3633534.1 efflux RND transporter permease subunit [Candidatus Neomarinimicrobiota bacterium]MBT3681676.1 efflux RND transporter permease subunit [Candidatus Neomarinimicrobiota bacterium]MBT3758356.1 efflux RND transporter permease subunit [Candidatus Neomarinimicrobiota bacterium]MBT3894990.1 efflux RND transporter permease subunit [Candidatus Neomarinimicrobiota bacterium]